MAPRPRAMCIVGAAWWLCACSDPGQASFERARGRYDQLISEGTPPQASQFDEVLALLDQVPSRSPRFKEASKLKANIERARGQAGSVRAPLSIAKPSADRPRPVVAQLERCGRLAQTLGLDGGLSEEGLRALEVCRREAERLELEHSSHGSSGSSHPPTGP